jgi:hypothetical protein
MMSEHDIFPTAALHQYLIATNWIGERRDARGHVFYMPRNTLNDGAREIMLPAADDERDPDDGSRPTIAQYQRDALQILAKVEARSIDELMRDIWPEQMKNSRQGASFGPHDSLCWERYDEERYPTESYLFFEVVTHRPSGKIVGQVERFRGGSPLTYAHACGERLGGYRTAAEAIRAVEKKLETFDPKQVLS